MLPSSSISPLFSIIFCSSLLTPYGAAELVFLKTCTSTCDSRVPIYFPLVSFGPNPLIFLQDFIDIFYLPCPTRPIACLLFTRFAESCVVSSFPLFPEVPLVFSYSFLEFFVFIFPIQFTPLFFPSVRPALCCFAQEAPVHFSPVPLLFALFFPPWRLDFLSPLPLLLAIPFVTTFVLRASLFPELRLDAFLRYLGCYTSGRVVLIIRRIAFFHRCRSY